MKLDLGYDLKEATQEKKSLALNTGSVSRRKENLGGVTLMLR